MYGNYIRFDNITVIKGDDDENDVGETIFFQCAQFKHNIIHKQTFIVIMIFI